MRRNLLSEASSQPRRDAVILVYKERILKKYPRSTWSMMLKTLETLFWCILITHFLKTVSLWKQLKSSRHTRAMRVRTDVQMVGLQRPARTEFSRNMRMLYSKVKLLRENQGSIEISLNESRRCLPESISQNSLNQTDVLSTDSSDSRTARQSLSPAKKMDMWFITKLSSCTEHLSKVNIFAVVLQVNPIKEIHIKLGIKSGQFVRVSSILIGDSTKEYFKLTFWERAADCVTSLVDGDVVVVKKVKIEKWQNEFYGQSMCDTVLVNLQRGNSTKIPPHWLTLVSKNEARSLMNWLNFRHPYLAVHQPWAPCTEVKWQTLPQLKANNLIHYRAKIVKVLTYNNVRGNYLFGLKKVNKVMASK